MRAGPLPTDLTLVRSKTITVYLLDFGYRDKPQIRRSGLWTAVPLQRVQEPIGATAAGLEPSEVLLRLQGEGQEVERLVSPPDPGGKEQNKRFRETRPAYHREYRERNLERVRTVERESKRRSRSKKPDVHKVRPMTPVPCSRPGCYVVVFVVASLAKGRRYCGEACATVMHRFYNLLNQLRRRRTPEGTYTRKCSRPRNDRRPIDRHSSPLPCVGSSTLKQPSVSDRKKPRNRDPPAVATCGCDSE
jgi:hypothetical protein